MVKVPDVGMMDDIVDRTGRKGWRSRPDRTDWDEADRGLLLSDRARAQAAVSDP
jgi:hypothetical protein